MIRLDASTTRDRLRAAASWAAAALLALAFAAIPGLARAGVGLTELPGAGGDGPVTVLYPSSDAEASVRRGPFVVDAARGGALAPGNRRLIVISHGSGGSPWTHTDLARRLVEAGFVVAFPQHRGDHALDPSTPGPESWERRPHEVSRAIDAVAADPRFAGALTFDKVGMYGMSAGGHTALSLAGGRWAPAVLKAHCDTHIEEDFATCVGLATRLDGGVLDSTRIAVARRVIGLRFSNATWRTHTDPRIVAIVAGVPFAADFDMASLARPVAALGLVTAAKDIWLQPRFHSDRVLAACAPCERVGHFDLGGHAALLSPPPPADVLPDNAKPLLADPPGFDRAAALPAVDRAIVAFFTRHLSR